MKKLKRIILNLLRHIPLIVCIIFMVVYLLTDVDFSLEKLLNYTPESPLLAAIFVVLLYSFKSLTVFFPITVLNILGGFIFPPLVAIMVNSIGVLCEFTIPYWIGRVSGTSFSDKLAQKHPRIAEIINTEKKSNNFFKSFFLRVISILPGDAVSMYLGAGKIPFGIYLLGSFLGTFPSMLTATLIGTSITDPGSPMFWISVISTAVISVGSIFLYHFWLKYKRKEKSEED